jgi:hypothetical protein
MTEKREFDISFIIVSWNGKDYLRQCLESLSEAIRNFRCEIIVVDNASTDGSWQMVRDEFPDVILLKNTNNEGFADANNRGINASQGKYLCLINSDVKILPNSISRLYDYIERHPDVGMLGPKVLNGDKSLQPSCRTLPTLGSSLFRAFMLDTCFKNSPVFAKHNMTHWNYSDTREVDILSGCFWLIRHDALREVGALDPRFFMYGEDMDFCKRFKESGWKIVFFHEAEIIHFGGASSANDPGRFWTEMQRANLQYWLKHFGKARTLLYYMCLLLHNFFRIAGFGVQRVLGLWSNEKKRTKFFSSWRALKWLLSISTMRSLIHGQFVKGGHNEQ